MSRELARCRAARGARHAPPDAPAQNVPGVLATINRVLADHGVNVEGQLLRTRDELGYVITDIGSPTATRSSTSCARWTSPSG